MTFACEWPISYSACATNEEGTPLCFESMSPLEQDLYEEIAVGLLANWTGGSLGQCPVVARPCRESLDLGSAFWGRGPFPGLPGRAGGYYPALIAGQWYNIACGVCGTDCGCTTTPSLRLPGPVTDIASITIDGAVVDPDAYRVDNYHLLIRQDGGVWPVCQDMSVDSGVGTFIITYTKGWPVPAGGQVAAGILACEIAKAACQDTSCALPQRMKTITRQGVSVTLIDEFKDLDEGKIGIWLIDSWVASVMKPRRGARVYSVDVPHPTPRRTTWRAMHGGQAQGGQGWVS